MPLLGVTQLQPYMEIARQKQFKFQGKAVYFVNLASVW